MDTTTLDERKVIKKHKNVRFINSFKMKNSSLKNLVEILPTDCCGILAAVFANLSSTDLKLLKQKVIK